MDLSDLRKEVHKLEDSREVIENFDKSWIRKLRANSNAHMPFLASLSQPVRRDINIKLDIMKGHVKKAERLVSVQARIKSHLKALIEWKLANFQGDGKKSKMIRNLLLSDDYLSLTKTIIQLKEYDESLRMIENHYNEVSELLHKSLSLEEMICYMQMPHARYLANLRQTQEKHKFIARDMGRHLLSMAQIEKQSLRKIPFR